ncbi:MAG: YicC/YloC family endoribonuclease [Deltaproteobacteria bacterium]|nr:YicC/YloC family endoribonuclease [Deltaproteobacteria bacterium]
MIKSMTAYGRGEVQDKETVYLAEIRSLNNRHRDIVFRMPRALCALEEEMRSLIASRVRRGRVEVFVQMETAGMLPPVQLTLNEPLAEAYVDIARQIADRTGVALDIRLDTLMQMKDVVSASPPSVDLDQVRPGLWDALNVCLSSLDEMKAREGNAIATDFEKRLERLDTCVNGIHQRVPHVVDACRRRLEERVQSMLGDASVVDETRLAQEVAFFAERSDITEELVRLRSHIKQFQDYLLVDEAVGRRLDFLVQEMNREVNTLGAKGSDTVISGTVVEMKAELEKLREQIQNVE